MTFLSKLRFNGLVGAQLFIILLVSGGHELKLALMVFAMTPWFITAMASEIRAIPEEQHDLAKTLGMSNLRRAYEVVILGTADKALEIVRQNTAIGWRMLTTVEGLVRSEGGIGSILLNQSKYMHLDGVFAILITVLIIGLCLDELLGIIKKWICPYASMGKGK